MTKMKNQTAVDFLASELAGHLGPSNGPELLEILERAKAMEKQQIIDAANIPIKDRGYDATKFSNIGEQYYNKTYGK